MQDQGVKVAEGEAADAAEPTAGGEFNDWSKFMDHDIMQQQSAIRDAEVEKMPSVGDKEPIYALALEYKSGSPILLEMIKMLSETYRAIRRTSGGGNCFFRSFMFAYLEYLLERQDRAEVDRVKANVERLFRISNT